jgi:hypothetical protein
MFDRAKSAVRWTFGTSEGHFALLFVSLVACAAGAAAGVPHAFEAAAALALPTLTKLKS